MMATGSLVADIAAMLRALSQINKVVVEMMRLTDLPPGQVRAAALHAWARECRAVLLKAPRDLSSALNGACRMLAELEDALFAAPTMTPELYATVMVIARMLGRAQVVLSLVRGGDA